MLAPQNFTRARNWPRLASAHPGRPHVGLCPIFLVIIIIIIIIISVKSNNAPLSCVNLHEIVQIWLQRIAVLIFVSGMGSSRTVLVLEDTSRTKKTWPWSWPWPWQDLALALASTPCPRQFVLHSPLKRARSSLDLRFLQPSPHSCNNFSWCYSQICRAEVPLELAEK